MGTIFSSIIVGDIPCHRVWEDANHLAFLDINPIQPGHCLVIPKREVSYIFDMKPDEYTALWDAVRTVEKKIRNALDCKRVVVSVVGWEVPHVHVHLVPTNEIDNFPSPQPCAFNTDEFPAIATKISEASE